MGVGECSTQPICETEGDEVEMSGQKRPGLRRRMMWLVMFLILTASASGVVRALYAEAQGARSSAAFAERKALTSLNPELIGGSPAAWFRKLALSLQMEDSEGIVLAAAGDVMLTRGVGRVIDEMGVDHPFERVKGLISRADVAFCNLETSISTGGTPIPGKGIWFRSRPEAATALARAGFDIVSLANNHILDYDTPSLLDTMNYLARVGVRYAGAGRNIEDARAPSVIEVLAPSGQIRVAFLAYNELSFVYWTSAYPRMFAATDTVPGTAPMVRAQILEDVKKARELADLVVVSLHWGTEYVSWPSKTHRKLARDIIDAGASLVLGHHPHVLQGFEVYRGGLIAYSLGNFIFDQRGLSRSQSLILAVGLGPEGPLWAQLIPVLIRRGQPAPAAGEAGEQILRKVAFISRPFGTKIVHDHRSGFILMMPESLMVLKTPWYL